QVLARHLRQTVELAPHDRIEAWVAVAKIDRRVPHLQVEEVAPLPVVEERAIATFENLRRVPVVDCIAVRAISGLEREQLLDAGLVGNALPQLRVCGLLHSPIHGRFSPTLLRIAQAFDRLFDLTYCPTIETAQTNRTGSLSS